MNWALYLTDMAPYLALGVGFIALVVVVNSHSHKLARHDEWRRVLELRVENLHKARAAAHARSLQLPPPPRARTPEPPPLSEARTIEVDEAMILSQHTAREKERDE